MNACAKEVMQKFDEIDLAYGHSDEYSFLFRKKTKVWNRRYDKILTNVVSCFSGSFPFLWKNFFPEQELLYVPSFDGRIVLLPTEREAKDYFRWRQVDCHINTQYNECFWNLINKDGYSHQQAYNTLITTQKKEKNELLFSKFGINYNDLPEIFRRGSILMRTEQILKGGHVAEQVDITQMESDKVAPPEEIPSDATTPCQRDALEKFTLSHENLVSDIFWEKYHFLFAKWRGATAEFGVTSQGYIQSHYNPKE